MTERRYVAELPELIAPPDYAGDQAGRLVRLRIRVTEDGVEVLGDAVRPLELEALLLGLDPPFVEQTLCG